MSSQRTSPDIPSATFSPGSADGASDCGSPVGPMTGLFGQAHAPASHSRRPESAAASLTNDTSGLYSSASSRSDDLQSYLENRLRERLNGSPSCEVIWSNWDTPWGQSRWRPRARARTISEIDIGLWPTVTEVEGNRGNRPPRPHDTGVPLSQMVATIVFGTWPTCRANEGTGSQIPPNRQGGPALKTTATATASDHKSRSASQETLDRNSRPLREMIFALWSTVRASDGEKGGPNQSFGAGGSPLPSQVSVAANTSNAPMENGAGSLHPEFAGWELGFPPEWISCAPSETRSTLALRRSSSAPISTLSLIHI